MHKATWSKGQNVWDSHRQQRTKITRNRAKPHALAPGLTEFTYSHVGAKDKGGQKAQHATTLPPKTGKKKPILARKIKGQPHSKKKGPKMVGKVGHLLKREEQAWRGIRKKKGDLKSLSKSHHEKKKNPGENIGRKGKAKSVKKPGQRKVQVYP